MGIKFINNQVAKEKQRIETTRPLGFAFPLGLSFGKSQAGASITTTAPQTQVGDSTVITFNSSADFTPDEAVIGEYLVIAGGGSGAGGRPARSGGGGGGAGGLSFGIATFPAVKHTANVGGGGVQSVAAGFSGAPNPGANLSTPGSDSHISRSSPSANVVSSTGGGRGGGTVTTAPQDEPGGAGGSGGGACGPFGPGQPGGVGGISSNTTQGSDGGNGTGSPNFSGGGGGGAGGEGGDAQATGDTGSKGGIGLHFSISGSNVAYSGGGGGGPYAGRANLSGTWIGGGPYGGGNASGMPPPGFNPAVLFAQSGLTNRGGGGGGGASGENNPDRSTGGGAGGSGVIILKITSSTGYFIT